MNSKLSHSETVNSMEQLYRSLETLEQNIGRSADRLPEQPLQLERLSGDEIAASGSLPERTIERLVGQVTTLAGEREPATLDTDHVLHGIEQRFDMLSDLLDRRQGEARERGQAVLRELERRFEDFEAQIDARGSAEAAKCAGIMNAIDARFEELARRLESRTQTPVGDFAHLESQLEDISSRLESSSGQAASVDPDIILNVESQVSELSRHLPGQSRRLPEFEDVVPRISSIEGTLAGNRQSILEATQLVAESAVRSFSGSEPDSAAVSALADDLGSLDELARRADERNSRTSDAIHDTLSKIVDRLSPLEEPRQTVFAEPIETNRIMASHCVRSIATGDDMRITADASMRTQAAERWDVEPVKRSQAPSLSIFSKLARVFSKKERTESSMTDPPPLPGKEAEAPTLDLEQPFKRRLTNRPLERDFGTTDDLNAVTRRVRDERRHPVKNSDTDDTKSDFLATARQAA